MLAQCNKLQDRFAIMDAFYDSTGTVDGDGINSVSYTHLTLPTSDLV